MPRPPRVQFPGAIYHVVTRGNGRQTLFHDGDHYRRLTRGLADEVNRSGWDVFAYCWMPNHIHLLLKTPQRNLSRGMQHWLSGYANWYAKRNRRTGHLFQGRYKAFLVEDHSYYWTLSRYIHLNPCRTARPLVTKPEDWPYGSYRGYARRSRRDEFVQYDTLLAAWAGERGGKNRTAAYRKFVTKGLNGPFENPLKTALREWVIGSEEFLHRMVVLADKESGDENRSWSRRLSAVNAKEVISQVARIHKVAPKEYQGFRSMAPGREIAALLCRRYTNTTLAELSKHFGLSHPDSAANLIRRATLREKESREYRNQITICEKQLAKQTGHQV